MPQDKVRVYALARELNVDSKELLDLCRDANFDVRNQLSSLEPDQRDYIVDLVRKGGGVATAAPPPSPASPSNPLASPQKPIRDLNRKRPASTSSAPSDVTADADEPAIVEEIAASDHEPAASEVETAPAEQSPNELDADSAAAASNEPPAESMQSKAPPGIAETQGGAGSESKPPSTESSDHAPPRPAHVPSQPGKSQREVRNLDSAGSSRGSDASGGRERRRPIPRPGSARHSVATPPPLKPQPKPTGEQQDQKSREPAGGRGHAKKIMDIPPELKGKGAFTFQLLEKGKAADKAVPVDDEEGEVGADGKRKRPKQVAGRSQRHRDREARGRNRQAKAQSTTLLNQDDEDRRSGSRSRLRRPRTKLPNVQPRIGKVQLELPITVRSLSEAVSRPAKDVLSVLFAQGEMITINSVLEAEMAEQVALELGCEVEIKRQLNLEELTLQETAKPDNPEDLMTRAPIVTIMGHVDHGKTSLLDQIRKSRVVDTEVGGITQVIRAWRVEVHDKPITFLDTPGHQAFTQMRARGANVTDIAVIVVAADDGVMPQTQEAINHAKAAGVAIVVAINKIDVPNANVARTEQQLYGLELLPDNMGGKVPFVYTSAVTGDGIDDLLEAILLVSEYELELRANPSKPAKGVCLEASVSEKEGVVATVLVQEGTLRTKEVMVCGSAYGSIRAMFDDLGRPIEEAGPGVPVRIWGLDVVPEADDTFHVVPDVATAGKISDKRKQRELEASQFDRGVMTLADLGKAEVAELKLILKADVKGALEAIRKELDRFQHDEVRINLLHTAVGGITESDVNLALTSPQNTIIVGFNAVPDDRARALADERRIEIRQYNIIYELADDIRAALEGKLKPREEVVHLGRAVVRDTFKISRVGTIAGCYVTQGRIERNAFVRVIRNGLVIYPPAERTVGLDSLKRFKDDVREVKEGFECGIKVTGYDDVKVDDVIEAYRIVKTKRSLEDEI